MGGERVLQVLRSRDCLVIVSILLLACGCNLIICGSILLSLLEAPDYCRILVQQCQEFGLEDLQHISTICGYDSHRCYIESVFPIALQTIAVYCCYLTSAIPCFIGSSNLCFMRVRWRCSARQMIALGVFILVGSAFSSISCYVTWRSYRVASGQCDPLCH
eukprot:767992-Hanusia_phi.AAC.6